jgi:antitoxin (DNA-binding transcriptional repressor) of toxin-antitoxin stability system
MQMQFITIRDLRSKSAKIQRELPQEKEMVLTSNGKPIAILTATSADRIEESLAMIRQVRAMRAVDSMQRRSVKAGTDRMRLEEINKEIAIVRKERQAR